MIGAPAPPQRPPRHRVLLIRPWDHARHGGGCCGGAMGGLAGDGPQLLGPVYRAVRAGLPAAVAVEIVDPHNTAFLLPAVIRDGRRHGLRWRKILRHLIAATGYAAIVVNGRVVSRGVLPTPEQALARIRPHLPAPAGAGPPPAPCPIAAEGGAAGGQVWGVP